MRTYIVPSIVIILVVGTLFYLFSPGISSWFEITYIVLLWWVTGWGNFLAVVYGIGVSDDMYDWITNNTNINLPYTSITRWSLTLIYYSVWFSFVYLFLKLWSIGAVKLGLEGIF